MSQLNIYVPADIEETIRKEAQAHRKSLSAYLAEVIKNHFRKNRWQKGFFKEISGKWRGDFPVIEQLLPEERDLL